MAVHFVRANIVTIFPKTHASFEENHLVYAVYFENKVNDCQFQIFRKMHNLAFEAIEL